MSKPNTNPATPIVTQPQNPAEAAAAAAAQKAVDAKAAAPEKAKATADRGKPATAVNLIVQTGADGLPEDITPGTVFRPAVADEAFLKANGAIREPTDGEIAIFDQFERMKAAAAASSADEALG